MSNPIQVHGCLQATPEYAVGMETTSTLRVPSTDSPIAVATAVSEPDRWVGVGHSDNADAFTAGVEAATRSLAGAEARLLLVFCADRYDLAELLRGVNQTSGDVPLVGCSTAGEIATSGPGDSGVVVTALGGPGFSIATSSSDRVSGRLREASADVAGCLDDVEPLEHKVLLLLTDGLSGDQQEVIRGAYSVVGAGVPLVGGCAGDNLKMKRTFQFHNHTVMDNGIVAAAIASSAPLGIGVSHGWRKVGEPMLVTRSAGSRVFSLNDKPALDVYLDRLQAPPLPTPTPPSSPASRSPTRSGSAAAAARRSASSARRTSTIARSAASPRSPRAA